MWQTPKTDWQPTDQFGGYATYNRLKNNLKHLAELHPKFFGKDLGITFRADKGLLDIPYASDFNAIEDALDIINANGFKASIGTKQTFSPNGSTIKYNELNRIENATLNLKAQYDCNLAIIKVLEFTLGDDTFIQI